jgi:hypothetical protein
MGMDISFYVERNVDGKWICMDAPTPNGLRKLQPAFGTHYRNGWYMSRNYAVFHVFCAPSDEVVSISPPRGLPTDVTPEVEAESQVFGDEFHFSWLTLKEIMEWPHWDDKKQNYPQKGTHRQLCVGVWENLIPALQALDIDPANIRCVFWFDH